MGHNRIRGAALRAVAGLLLLAAMPLAPPAQAGPAAGVLSEDAALDHLLKTFERRGTYKHRIALDCIALVTEETTRAWFEVAVRETHKAPCAGDPGVMPVIDRYKVYRKSGRIEWYEPADGEWRPIKMAKHY